MGGRCIHCILVAALVPALGACAERTSEGFVVERISFTEATATIREAVTRVELELMPDWGERRLRELELRPAHRLQDDERVESRIVGPGFHDLVTDGSCSGTLTLALPGVEVRFDERTRFEDQDGDRISCVDFVTNVEAFVALGMEPQVTAFRRPPATPQSPFDPVFFAHALRIDDEDDDGDQRPEIDVNVGPANLVGCDDTILPIPGCVGALRVLGSVLAVDGDETEVERGDPAPRLEVRFRGIVRSVDAMGRELRLESGAVVRLVAGSEIEFGRAPVAGDLVRTIDDVDRLKRSGKLIEAHGTAAVIATDPLVLWVSELELEVERDLGVEAYPPVVEIAGDVIDAAVGEQYVELPFDTRLRVTEVSAVEGDLPALPDVGSAMSEGRRVRAVARVVVEEFQYPTLVTRADRVAFLVDE